MTGRKRSSGWILAATILASSMAYIDQSIVNVSLPAIQADLRVPVSSLQWIVNAYMLFLGALILAGGAAGDRFGRRRIFSLGIVMFGGASLWCGVAASLPQLVLGRSLQGVAGALLVPGSLAIITATHREADRPKAIGTWAGASAMTTALGPLLGGWIVETFSWRPIFFLNVPVAVVAWLITMRHVPASRGDRERSIDWFGALVGTTALGAVLFGVIDSSNRGWDAPSTWGALAGGALLLALFVVRERNARDPMMPLTLFRSATFRGANVLTLLLYFALSGIFFLVPLNLIQVQHYSPLETGAAFLPFTLLLAGLSRWIGAKTETFGARRLLIGGPLLAAAGMALFALPRVGGTYWTTFFPPMAVLGLGMSLSVAPLSATVMGAVSDEHAGAASGINNAASRTAGAIAVAVVGVIVIAVFGSTLESTLADLPVSPQVRRQILAQHQNLGEVTIPSGVAGERRTELERAVDEAFVKGFRTAVLIAAGLAALSSLAALRWIRPGEERNAP